MRTQEQFPISKMWNGSVAFSSIPSDLILAGIPKINKPQQATEEHKNNSRLLFSQAGVCACMIDCVSAKLVKVKVAAAVGGKEPIDRQRQQSPRGGGRLPVAARRIESNHQNHCAITRTVRAHVAVSRVVCPPAHALRTGIIWLCGVGWGLVTSMWWWPPPLFGVGCYSCVFDLKKKYKNFKGFKFYRKIFYEGIWNKRLNPISSFEIPIE